MVRLDRVDWGEIYAGIIADTGWTWEYIDEFMTLSRLSAMSRFNRKVAAGAGKENSAKKGNLQDLMAAFGTAGGRINHGGR